MAEAIAGDEKRRLVGLGVSRGIGRGKVIFLKPGTRPLVRIDLKAAKVDEEILRFRSAIESARQQLIDLSPAPADQIDPAVSDIFGVQLLILESSFINKTEQAIRDQGVNAEWALKAVLSEQANLQESLPEGQFREKYLDIEDVANRIMRSLSGGRPSVHVDPHAVVVARDMRPSAIVELARHNAAGLITETGGWTSHMSIIAREFRLPMVTGIRNPEKFLSAGDVVVVDGDAGEVTLDTSDQPDGHRGRAFVELHAVDRVCGRNVFTTDGIEIIIRANSEDPTAYKKAAEYGARGIGLYRSESLLRDNGTIPTEDEQFVSYLEMAGAVGHLGVAIRTFDIPIIQISGKLDECEANPALGLRAIRSGLADPHILRSQLRAILRASDKGRVDIILPMISNVEEIIRSRALIDRIRVELAEDGVEIAAPRVGIMVEVPSAVFAARHMAKHIDFLCLGTNDLVQYLLAVDRDNDAVADWYQTLHPAVLSAVKSVLEVGSMAGIPTTVCGEMAGSPFYVPVLIGLGARELSININSIRPISKLISAISTSAASALVESVSECETAKEIEQKLREYYLLHWEEYFPPGIIFSRHR